MPVPRVAEVPEVRREGQWLLLDLRGGMVDVPPEVYLRQFRDTPANDLDALAELCRLGLVRSLNTAHPYGDLPISQGEQWERALAELAAVLWPGQECWHGDERERDEVWRRHAGAFPVHVAEVAYRVRAMQRATDHVLAWQLGEPVERAWRDCADESEAWRNFTSVTGAALRDFHVRVYVEAGRHPAEEFNIGDVYTTLYSAATLQLVNDISSEETFRRCANETCGRPFVRQLGRADYGHYRSEGVRFCSKWCARAQVQREYRRRKRNGG